jgi:hypothetical protein
MDPKLYALSRDLMALPGFDARRIPCWLDPDGNRRGHEDRHSGCVPDLTDPAIEGVLLRMWQGDYALHRSAREVSALHRFVWQGPGTITDHGWHVSAGSCAGEAIARAMVARGRHL